MSDVAIAHDRFRTLGGAERVAIEQARALDAPIYAGWVDHSIIPDDVDVVELFGTLPARMAYRAHHLLTDLYQMHAWQHVPELYDHETVIINKTNPGWFVPRDTQTVLWYLHSTPRGMYDQFHRRGSGLLKPWIAAWMRALYAPNVRTGDHWLCNSELVRRRAKTYWSLEDVEVVYPPVDTEAFDPGAAPTGEYYLTLGRLHHAKRTRDVVETANELGIKLVVAGEGPQQRELDRLAGETDTVTIEGYVSEARKRELYAGARAFIMNAENEDFGMTPIEAMAAGTPVLGVDEGYTRYQIRDGKNGRRYKRGELAEAIGAFQRTGVAWSADEIASWVRSRYGRKRFREELRAAVAEAEENSRIEVEQPVVDPLELPLTADGGGQRGD